MRTITRKRYSTSGHMLSACVLPSLFVFLSLSACVTERRPLSAPSPADPATRAPQPTDTQSARATEPIITQPTDQRTTSARIIVGVQPLGTVPYDAQVLPIISPDGAFLATQTGDAPDWPTLLAEPGARSNLTTKIRIFDISGQTPREITPDEPLPLTLLLGRSADERGFLVESPRPDGSRWIGRVHWKTGALTWLVKSDRTNAFATLNTRGGLAWMSYKENGATKLRVRFASGADAEKTLPARTSRVYPSFTNDPTTLFLFELTDDGIDVAARPLDGNGIGPTVARRRVTNTPDPFLAYQALVSVASPVHASNADPRFTFYNPASGRATLFNHSTSELTALADRSIACAPIHDGASPGLMLTTPDGLVYQRVTTDGLREPTRMLAESHVPRATSSDQFPAILISPAPDSPGRLNLTRLFLPEDTP